MLAGGSAPLAPKLSLCFTTNVWLAVCLISLSRFLRWENVLRAPEQHMLTKCVISSQVSLTSSALSGSFHVLFICLRPVCTFIFGHGRSFCGFSHHQSLPMLWLPKICHNCLLRLVLFIPMYIILHIYHKRPHKRNSSNELSVILFHKYKYFPIKAVLKAVKWLRWLTLCPAKLHTIYKH